MRPAESSSTTGVTLGSGIILRKIIMYYILKSDYSRYAQAQFILCVFAST